MHLFKAAQIVGHWMRQVFGPSVLILHDSDDRSYGISGLDTLGNGKSFGDRALEAIELDEELEVIDVEAITAAETRY